MHKRIDNVEDARLEVRRALGLSPDTRTLEKDEMKLLYEELTGEPLDYPEHKYDTEYITAKDLSVMIAEELGIPRYDRTNYLRKAELLAAIGRLTDD